MCKRLKILLLVRRERTDQTAAFPVSVRRLLETAAELYSARSRFSGEGSVQVEVEDQVSYKIFKDFVM